MFLFSSSFRVQTSELIWYEFVDRKFTANLFTHIYGVSRRKRFIHATTIIAIYRTKLEKVFNKISLYQKSSFSRLSIEHAAAIRTPSSLSTAARSIPLSSANSICKKSPTLWVTGRSANWHFSFRLGNGTTTCGNPRIYFTVTSAIKNVKLDEWRTFESIRIDWSIIILGIER